MRAHSDTPAPFAAFSMAFNSSGVTRARTMQLFASPLGSGGRPAFGQPPITTPLDAVRAWIASLARK